jgi:hypothetical protein
MSIWDVVTQRWVKPEGEFIAYVGQNAFDVQAQASIW